MGYDVHITRRTPWWEDEGEQITTQEWAAVVAADPELEMVQVARVSPRGQDAVLEYRHEWLAQMVTTQNGTLTAPGWTGERGRSW
ncbi:hypothetical protein [Streptomyces sp. Ru72]|uniref:hypothetical protein n=1 Tax=Streptomyces sp. Ru72 TaxID=2080747 RepID=UPI0011AFF213|nr:hypothetical protein [Streptomyces sp. Ru72]